MAARPEGAARRAAGAPIAERLETLRLAGARHRLGLAMALQELRSEGARFGPLRAIWGVAKALLGRAPGVAPLFQGLLARSRWLAPIFGRLLFGIGGRRSAAVLRGLVEAGTLGFFLVGLARRLFRRARD